MSVYKPPEPRVFDLDVSVSRSVMLAAAEAIGLPEDIDTVKSMHMDVDYIYVTVYKPEVYRAGDRSIPTEIHRYHVVED